jgi:hypothetical protein
MGGMIKCPNCGEILHSLSRHDFVKCGCEAETFVDGGEAYIRIGGKFIKDIQIIEHIHRPDNTVEVLN